MEIEKSVLVGDFSLSLSVSESLCSGYSSYKEKGYEIENRSSNGGTACTAV